jgi:hypothetical protein
MKWKYVTTQKRHEKRRSINNNGLRHTTNQIELITKFPATHQSAQPPATN